MMLHNPQPPMTWRHCIGAGRLRHWRDCVGAGRSPSLTRRRLLQGALRGVAGLAAWHQGWPWLRAAAAQKRTLSGQMAWAVHIQIAPTWFDPAETPGIITPFMFMYAMHDALLKPMPDNPMA